MKLRYYPDAKGGFIGSEDGQTQVCDFREGMGERYGKHVAASLNDMRGPWYGANDSITPARGAWSRTLPTVEGFYWYRDAGSNPEVILWDQEMQWVCRAGTELAMGADLPHKIEGEFWTVPLNPPNPHPSDSPP